MTMNSHPAPMFTCKFCGSPSYLDPNDQSAPRDYCHPADHGELTEADADDDTDEPEDLDVEIGRDAYSFPQYD